MKILHIISQAPDFTGSGKFIQQIIVQAKATGHENFLVAAVQPGCDIPKDLIPRDRCVLVEFGGKDLDFPIPGMSDAMPYESVIFSKMSSRKLAAYQRVFREKIAQALDRFRPDMIHTHHLWIVSALARQAAPDLPMVTTCHGTCLRQHEFCPDISRNIRKPLQKIDSIMALSQSQKIEIMELFCLSFDPGSGHIPGQENLQGQSPDRVPIIAGGYDHALFRQGDKSGVGPVELIYAGKLCRAKGVPWLLKSLEKIADMPFLLHLVGGGTGVEKQVCLDLTEALGAKVIVHGPLNHRDLAELMGRCHLFVLPSFFEGVPLVLMEALACGCRLLATDLPGVLDLLSPANGKMIHFFELPPLKNVDTPHGRDEKKLEERLAKTLKKLMEEILKNPVPDSRFICERTAPYSWEKVFARIESVYLSVKSKSTP
ncbi:MAG: glycosyltransferase family 4 protein [Desulfobacteraceae bacterium]|nr:glycosyltransferase family 4 protein [Desulfobacteraceae bacterium]